MTLAGVAQWIEHRPVKQRVAGLIPSQGTCLGCGPGPRWGVCVRGNHTLMFLSLSVFLPSPLSKNKQNLKKKCFQVGINVTHSNLQ